jgi:hypothetical protein
MPSFSTECKGSYQAGCKPQKFKRAEQDGFTYQNTMQQINPAALKSTDRENAGK